MGLDRGDGHDERSFRDSGIGGLASKRDSLLNGWSRNPGDKVPNSSNTSSSLNVPTARRGTSPGRRSRSPGRRKRYWPPDPIVEDAVDSLAKESLPGHQSDSAYGSGDEQPQVRGAIDQQPIILEADTTSDSDGYGSSERDKRRQNTKASRESSRGKHHKERNRSRDPPPPRGRKPSRDDDVEDGQGRRGSKLRVDTKYKGPTPDLEARAPSPYSFTPKPRERETEKAPASAVEQFLSPGSYFPSSVSERPEQRRSGSYNLSKDLLRERAREEFDLPVRDSGHHDRRRSGRYSFVNQGSRRTESVDPVLTTQRHHRRANSSSGTDLPRPKSKLAEPFNPSEDRDSTPRRSRKGPGKIEIPERAPIRAAKTEMSSDESEEDQHHRRRSRRVRSPLVTTDGLHVPTPSDSYFALPKGGSHQRSASGRYTKSDLNRLQEIKAAEKAFQQDTAPSQDKSRPTTPTKQTPRPPPSSSPGPGSASFPWSESLPSGSSTTSSFSSSRVSSRPGSSAGSTPPSPVSPVQKASVRPESPHSNRSSLDISTRGRRARPDAEYDQPRPEPSITPRPNPAQGTRGLPPGNNLGASLPGPNDFLQARPRIDVVSPGSTRRSTSYTHEHDGRPSSPRVSPKTSARSSRESSPITLARERLRTTPLPPCPRSRHTKGHEDWYSLVNFSDFHICPPCLNSTFGSTPHRGYFVPSSSRLSSVDMKCDFSLPWIRVAWVLTLKQRRRDLDLVYATARIASAFKPCPRGTGQERQWYSIVHPSTGYMVNTFNICPCCKESVESLFPALRDVFLSASSRPAPGRACNLRFDSKRFLRFVDELEATAKRTARSSSGSVAGPVDLTAFADFAAERGSLRECPGPDPIAGRGWHIIPNLPEFTVCEECFHDIVWPLVQNDSWVAGRFSRRLQFVAPPDRPLTCRLTSPKLQEIFHKAVEREDLDYLWTRAKRAIDDTR